MNRLVIVLCVLCNLVVFGGAFTNEEVFGIIDNSDSARLIECMNEQGDQFLKITENNVIKRTPLIYACSEGKLEAANKIIEFHLDAIKDRDAEGRTPLMWASWNGHLELVKLLLEKGSRFKDIDLQARNSLMFAVMGKHLDIVSLAITSLEQSPHDIESLITHKDLNGKNSLDYALERGATQIYNHLNKFMLAHQENANTEPIQMVGLRTSSRVHHVGDDLEVKEPLPVPNTKKGGCSGNVLNWIRVCDSNGVCIPEGSKDCCPYKCDESTNQCRRTCDEDSDCCGNFVCSSNRKCVLKKNLFDWRSLVGFATFVGLVFYFFS